LRFVDAELARQLTARRVEDDEPHVTVVDAAVMQWQRHGVVTVHVRARHEDFAAAARAAGTAGHRKRDRQEKQRGSDASPRHRSKGKHGPLRMLGYFEVPSGRADAKAMAVRRSRTSLARTGGRRGPRHENSFRSNCYS